MIRTVSFLVPPRSFLAFFVAFSLIAIVAAPVPAAAQQVELPEPGDVYTIDNIEEAYPYLQEFFPEYMDTWREENQDLRIQVRETRTAKNPDPYIQATRDLADQVSIRQDGSVEGYQAGQPFPTERTVGEGYDRLDRAIENDNPLAGWMVFWNFLYHPKPNNSTAGFSTMLADRHNNQRYRKFRTYQSRTNHRTQNYPDGEINPHKPFKYNYVYSPVITAPASVKDISQLLMLPDNIVDFNATMKVYSYLPSLRRVIPQSGTGSAHCAPTGGTDYYVDDNFGFTGVPSWFNVKFVGMKKLLVPFDPDNQFEDMENFEAFNRNFTQGALPKRARWELRDHYVITLEPKQGHSNYCYPLRRMYIDAEVWWPNVFETVDKSGNPWKMSISTPGKGPWYPGGSLDGEVYYDNAGVQNLYDLQAKHGTWSTNYIQKTASDGHSVSDLTPTGLLKVIK